MKLSENWRNLLEKVRGMSQEQMGRWRTIMMVAIFVDIFGVYWFLNQKKLSVYLLLIILGLFTFLLIEGPQPTKLKKKPIPKEIKKEDKPKMPEETENEEEEEVVEEQSLDFGGNFNLSMEGLPSSDDMQKRLDDALGTF